MCPDLLQLSDSVTQARTMPKRADFICTVVSSNFVQRLKPHGLLQNRSKLSRVSVVMLPGCAPKEARRGERLGYLFV